MEKKTIIDGFKQVALNNVFEIIDEFDWSYLELVKKRVERNQMRWLGDENKKKEKNQ